MKFQQEHEFHFYFIFFPFDLSPYQPIPIFAAFVSGILRKSAVFFQ